MTKMTGKEALMQILRQEEVEYVFGISGATEAYFMDALEDNPDIKYVLGLHEVVAMGMAQGYARTSGKVGVVNLHTNTGLAASLPILANVNQGGIPLVVTAGQQDTRLVAQEPALGADLVRIANPFTKWAAEIINVEDIPLIMRRAFKVAAHPPQGPVFVALPQNLMDQTLDFEYIKGELPFTNLHPDPDAIRAAAGLLFKARNPVIVVEDGVTKNNALDEVVKFAEQIGARVYQPWMSDVNFPVSHPLYMGDLDVISLRTREMFESVDVLIVIGALFFSQAMYLPKPLVPSGTQVIQIDNNPWQIGKNFPVAVGIEGTIKASIADLTGTLKRKLSGQKLEEIRTRTKTIQEENRKVTQSFLEKAQREKDNMPIAATRLMQEIRDAVKPGTRIVDDCWSYSAILRRTLGFSEARSYQRARGGGSIGEGLPGALGVKLASPDRPVVCVSGDGSAMWSIQSLWTAARYNIPVTYIILANACYRQVRLMKTLLMGEKAKGRYLGTDLCNPNIDFCGLAESLGVHGSKVGKPDELAGVLKSALATNRPELVEVAVDSRL